MQGNNPPGLLHFHNLPQYISGETAGLTDHYISNVCNRCVLGMTPICSASSQSFGGKSHRFRAFPIRILTHITPAYGGLRPHIFIRNRYSESSTLIARSVSQLSPFYVLENRSGLLNRMQRGLVSPFYKCFTNYVSDKLEKIH